MEKNKPTGHGGARKGAGRPKGSTDKVTIAGLLDAIDATAGESYVELLAQDFVHARNNDRHLAAKYHNLILNKVAATLNTVEVVDSEDAVEAKAEAFKQALVELTQVNRGKKT